MKNKPRCTFCESRSGLFVNIAGDELFVSWSQLMQSSMEWRASSVWLVFMDHLKLSLSLRDPQGFSASVLYVERHVVKGALLVQGVSESPFQRFISSMKFTPNSFLWGAIMPFNYLAHFWDFTALRLDYSWLSHTRLTQVIGIRHN